MSHIWTTVDLDAGRCTLGQLGKVRPLPEVEILDAVVLDDSPEAMRSVAINTLLRLAQQNRDLPTALKAANALLDRALPQLQPSALPGSQEKAPLDWPGWLEARRLAYQEGPQEPLESQHPIESAPTPPSPLPHPSRGIPEPPASLHLVPEPRFHDAPGHPWDGNPFRRPNGLAE